jgi:hypothetical protein
MFNKRSTRTAVVGLLIASSCDVINNGANAVQLGSMTGTTNAVSIKAEETTKDEGVNPDFASSMTNNHWKLYKPDETYEMFRKAEYKKNEQKSLVQSHRVATAAAADNLHEAKRYLT